MSPSDPLPHPEDHLPVHRVVREVGHLPTAEELARHEPGSHPGRLRRLSMRLVVGRVLAGR